jgi:predicted metal-dependent HD superfamily phosphohydrolase
MVTMSQPPQSQGRGGGVGDDPSLTTTMDDSVADLTIRRTWMASNQNFEFPKKSNDMNNDEKNNSSSSSNATATKDQGESSSSSFVLRREALFQYWQEATSTLIQHYLVLLGGDDDDDDDDENNNNDQVVPPNQQDQQDQQPFLFHHPSTSVVVSEWMERILHCHSESQRHYHTLVHLEELLAYLDVLSQVEPWMMRMAKNHKDTNASLDQHYHHHHRSVLILSIFFHDIIYDPRSATNEEDSAQLFQQFCHQLYQEVENGYRESSRSSTSTSTSRSFVQRPRTTTTTASTTSATTVLEARVVQSILATKSHKPVEDTKVVSELLRVYNKKDSGVTTTTTKEEMEDDDDDDDANVLLCANYFLDMDMAVLAKTPWSAYRTYALLIRQEYQFVDRTVYCEKRAQVLQQFLSENTFIFHTERMHHALEALARQNIQHEISLLQQGIIPGEEENENQ